MLSFQGKVEKAYIRGMFQVKAPPDFHVEKFDMSAAKDWIPTSCALADSLERLPDKPRDGRCDALKISIADLHMSWFQIRFETDTFCTSADTDSTMTPRALADLYEIGTRITSIPTILFINFDNESVDTARLIVSSDNSGYTRLIIVDWCETEIAPRLDILVPTKRFSKQLINAIITYQKETTYQMDGLFPIEF